MRPLSFLATMAFVLLLASTDAFAGGGGGGGALLSRGTDIVNNVYRTGVSIIYVVGGIGILVMAVFAFLGRFKWGHFFALAGGLFLVAATDQLISFLSGGTASSTGGAMGAGLF